VSKQELKLKTIKSLCVKNENLHMIFSYNLFSKKIEIKGECPWGGQGDLTDADLIQLKYYLSVVHGKEYPVYIINEALLIQAMEQTYHPIKDYLNSLKWDGIGRLRSWMVEICGAVRDQYIEDISEIVLCAAIKRIYEPGCKFDYMSILEGDQGIGKTTLLQILGGEWYINAHLSTNESKKDLIDLMRKAWIIEISELSGFKKAAIEDIKNFISCETDRVRMPYARNSEDFPRHNIFIGTHNPSGDNQYLRDDTGNRRFWPVSCADIDIEKAKKWKDQLWAEAMIRYKKIDMYLTSNDSLLILKDYHSDRESHNPWDDMIQEYIVDKQAVFNKTILKDVFHLDVGKLSYLEMQSKATAIGKKMKREGWVKGDNKKRGWYFKPGFEHLAGEGEEQMEMGEVGDWDD